MSSAPSLRRSDPDGPTDAQLVARALDGRADAWERLVDRYARLVHSIPRRYGMAEADAEDVVQGVFLILFRRLETLRDEARLSSWLITTTHRECWRLGKKASASPISASALDAAVVDVGRPDPDEAERWERQHLVRRALETLGGKCQALLTRLFQGGGAPDYQAVARELDMPVGSIGPTRARCFTKLEAILRSLGVRGLEAAGDEADADD